MTGTVAVVAIGSLAVLQSSAAAEDSAPTDCIVHGPLKEVSHVTPHDNGPKGPSVGDTATYYGELYNQDGVKVGSVKGTGVLFYDVLNSEWMQIHSGYDRYKDGTVFWTGTNSIASAIAGEEQSFFATGGTGRYAGKIGQRKFWIIDRTDPHTPISTAAVTLCAATVVPTVPMRLR